MQTEINKLISIGEPKVPRSAFSNMENRSEAGIEQLWDRAKELMEDTMTCMMESADENGWGMSVIKPALDWETSDSDRKCMKPTFSAPVNM